MSGTAVSRRAFGGSLLAMGRAMAFLCLMIAGAVLLLIVVASPVLAVAGLGHLLQDELRTSGTMDAEATADLLGGLTGLVSCRLVVPRALLLSRSLATRTRTLSRQWCGVPIASAYQPPPADLARLRYRQKMNWLLNDVGTWRDLLWLAVSAGIGSLLLIAPLMAAGVGVVTFIIPALYLAGVNIDGLRDVTPPTFPGNTPAVLFVIGLALVALGLWTAPWMLRGYAGLARVVLAPSEQTELERRVAHLAQSRRETLDTGAAELRRIERDLHDGAQARLVAMGLTLDAAGRLIDTDPAAARALLIEARDASAKALGELRDLVRGIHPPVLADRGLADAVRALALDCPLRVTVTGSLSGRPAAPVESAAYFAVSELLANVAKHSGAHAAEVDLRHESGALRIIVTDDGAGGADPSRGTGLRGIARRVSAFDGVLVVSSPAAGPTAVSLEMPCALS
jgi:signal transduction histidine kinase